MDDGYDDSGYDDADDGGGYDGGDGYDDGEYEGGGTDDSSYFGGYDGVINAHDEEDDYASDVALGATAAADPSLSEALGGFGDALYQGAGVAYHGAQADLSWLEGDQPGMDHHLAEAAQSQNDGMSSMETAREYMRNIFR